MRQQVIGGIVPTIPGVLREPLQLLVQTGDDDVVHVRRDFEGHGDFLPAHGHHGRVVGGLVHFIEQRFLHCHRLRVHVDAQRI